MTIYQKLTELGIDLPERSVPAAAYLPSVRAGSLVFVSGHLAKQSGLVWTGRLGETMSTEDGARAARAVAIDLLSTLHAHLGDLTQVVRIVKLVSLVNSTTDFTQQHIVTNGASDLFAQVFGERGAHARSALGVAQLPLGACVEIELIAEVQTSQIVN